jgi:hypothetical protein
MSARSETLLPRSQLGVILLLHSTKFLFKTLKSRIFEFKLTLAEEAKSRCQLVLFHFDFCNKGPGSEPAMSLSTSNTTD